MKQILSVMMSLLFLLAPTGAKGGQCDHWYIRHTGSHEAPICDSRFQYIDSYDTYYIDKKADETNKVIYLTFDAGYENGNIEKILDIMKQEQVTAAFFILENMVYRNAGLLKRMQEEGHLICNHTAKHKDMSKADEATFKAELESMERIYAEGTGCELAKFYRPPEGKFVECNLKWAKELGYKTVLWSFAYPDWDNNKQPDPQRAKQKILDNTHNGEILLLHPTSATNAAILGDLIREWKSMGYRFGSLDQL